MSLVADTGGLYALYDADDAHHAAIREIIQKEPGPIIVPSAVLGELDYLLREFLGVDAELDFLDGLISGALSLEPMTPADVVRSRELVATYRDLDLGLVDSSVIATAERLGIRRVLTVDEHDFRAVRPKGKPLTLLPSDSGTS
ncbi:MAG TPA: PIN domain-containing protein [Vicinamibacteria bacterium]|nr:PIN domain-containing protein [Vicinamibacteria bacterium]